MDYHDKIYGRKPRKPRKRSQNPICSGTFGAISELQVATHLMIAGWHVYRSLSPHAPVDLMAFKGEAIMLIEVKTTQASFSACQAAATHLAIYDPKTNSVQVQEIIRPEPDWS